MLSGTVLGPLMFLLYMTRCRLFANDSAIHTSRDYSRPNSTATRSVEPEAQGCRWCLTHPSQVPCYDDQQRYGSENSLFSERTLTFTFAIMLSPVQRTIGQPVWRCCYKNWSSNPWRSADVVSCQQAGLNSCIRFSTSMWQCPRPDKLDLVLSDRPVRGTVTQQRLRVPLCRSTEYQKSFVPRTITEWNSLPNDITSPASRYLRLEASWLPRRCHYVHSTHLPHHRDIQWRLVITIQIQIHMLWLD